MSTPPMPKKRLQSALDVSTFSVTPSELEALYEEHYMMKEQIQILKDSLVQCETKWNRVVNSIVKENVELKASEEHYKKKYQKLVEKINEKKKRKSQEIIKSETSQSQLPISKKDLMSKKEGNRLSQNECLSQNEEDFWHP